MRAMMIRLYPEMGAGGFSRADSTIAFFSRVNALVGPTSIVLDLGAGRGQRFVDDPVQYRRELATLQGRCGAVIGVDIDPIVAENPRLDRWFVLEDGGSLPLDDDSIDLIYSDFVFEHIRDPASIAPEILRILKPGGWLCARTPNKHGYIALGARLIPNRRHAKLLRWLQPQRRDVDVFPTEYRLCTRRDIGRWFPPSVWENYSYIDRGEVAYVGASRLAGRTLRVWLKLCPQGLGAMWFILLRKRCDGLPREEGNESG